MPVYDYLVDRIRTHDPTRLIFYEPVTWGVFGAGDAGWTGTGFDRVPGSLRNRSERNRSVLSYHYYCWLLQTDDPASELPFWKELLCDEVITLSMFDGLTMGKSFEACSAPESCLK
ncbi:unnamed protein product [Protopolystoma xenopodis]|uniref:Glycoside hydrolase family 5 domain-containing protein n=1 Tax=Protopolystoma xenopodis TaxID=117903 RepID=A0A448X7W4_9PLAT|nr:unnamed protein product [Protopolystoma xenopodis]